MKKENIYIVVISILLFYVIFYFSQRSFLYHPASKVPLREEYKALDMKVVSFTTKDKIKLKAWYKKSTSKNVTILYFHGNSGHWANRYFKLKPYIDAGYGLLLFSYRGFANNAGFPSEQGLYKDARAAIEFLKDKTNCIVYMGESLGTGVAVQMAKEIKPAGVILASPFISITKMAKLYYSWSPLLPWDEFDSLSKISSLNALPLLILHGKKDVLVPYSHAVALFNKAQNDKKLILYANKNHNNLYGGKVDEDIFLFLDKVNQQCIKAAH